MFTLTVFAQNSCVSRLLWNCRVFCMASTSKKRKVNTVQDDDNETKKKNSKYDSIMEFPFMKERVRILSSAETVPEDSRAIVYWTSRESRVQDNWAALYAQKLALKNQLPLYVCFCLLPRFLDATHRHFHFLLKGLEEASKEYNDLNINFYLLEGSAVEVLPKFVKENKAGAVVCDFSPLRHPIAWVDELIKNLSDNIPVVQVDAHNIVPCWIASNKLEYSARTIRNKINSKLGDYLTEFPPLIKHPHSSNCKPRKINWNEALNSRDVDKSIVPCSWAVPGTEAGLRVLQEFCNSRLKSYSSSRNDPTLDALSNLSPWFHFGQISVQRAVLAVKKYNNKYPESVAAFCEEAIIRRELSDNFCFYNNLYDSVEGASDWAKNTLNIHRKDKREFTYTTEQLRDGKTHDDLWNAAQKQLVTEGKMHGFLRMYWAKKILEWTPTPEKALQDAIYLNDRYSLDGRDPNGYVGCMWSICGIHDQGWAERQIFGKIRYMNYKGCLRKFDVKAFVSKYRS